MTRSTRTNAIKITIFSAVFDGFWSSSVLTICSNDKHISSGRNFSPNREPVHSLWTGSLSGEKKACSQVTLDQLFPIPCLQQDVSTRVSRFIAVDMLGKNNVLEAQEQFWVFCLVVWSVQRATSRNLAFCRGWRGSNRLCFRLYVYACSLSEDYLDFWSKCLSS